VTRVSYCSFVVSSTPTAAACEERRVRGPGDRGPGLGVELRSVHSACCLHRLHLIGCCCRTRERDRRASGPELSHWRILSSRLAGMEVRLGKPALVDVGEEGVAIGWSILSPPPGMPASGEEEEGGSRSRSQPSSSHGRTAPGSCSGRTRTSTGRRGSRSRCSTARRFASAQPRKTCRGPGTPSNDALPRQTRPTRSTFPGVVGNPTIAPPRALRRASGAAQRRVDELS
jgi:hypothetical protein